MRTRTSRSLVYLGAVLGIIVSGYAGAEFYDASLAKACTVNSVVSCSKILGSGLTTTFGVQDWIWGMAGFVVILALGALAELRPGDAGIAYFLLLVTTAGVAFSVYFGYVEIVEIGGVCPVCVTAYLMGVVAWVGSIGLARRAYRRAHRVSVDAAPAA
ncbi:MAG: vitamin K epoxide reductase family protein [Thermoplasmata archaeon]|jgi:uncharacterized membrane protein